MPNLIRPVNKYLLNAVAAQADVPVDRHEAAGDLRPLFIIKSLGICIPGNIVSTPVVLTANVKPGKAGTAKVMKLVLAKLRNVTEAQTEFFLNITKKASWNGQTNEVFDIPHSYNYVKKNFSTSSNGSFDAADVTDILQTLVNRINADKQLGDNHVSTGAAVTAALVAANIDPASYTGTPTGATTAVTITAVTPGTGGNVTLVVNSTSTIAELIAAWNLDYFGTAATLELTTGDGTQIPTANIVIAGGTASTDAYITLTAKDASIDFSVDVDTADFTATTTTARVAPVGKWDDIARMFPLKAEDAGTLVEQPVVGTYYTQIELLQTSVGAENAVASGTIGKEQRHIIYVPNALVDADSDYLSVALIHACLAANITEPWT